MNQRVLVAISAIFGYRPTGSDWLRRLPKLDGSFRRSKYENAYRLFVGLTPIVTIALIVLKESSKPGLGDLSSPFMIAMIPILLVLSFYTLWPLGQSYVFKNGTLSCSTWTGRTLWQEDIRDLESITCAGGRGIMWLTLKLPNRKRRIELTESLQSVLWRPESQANKPLKNDARKNARAS